VRLALRQLFSLFDGVDDVLISFQPQTPSVICHLLIIQKFEIISCLRKERQ